MIIEHLDLAGPYDIVYADPPWDYKGREQFGFAGDVGQSTGGAIRQYPTMSTTDICDLPVGALSAPDALLYMWATGPLLIDALITLYAWEFDYVQIPFVWDKQRINPGYYTLTQCEFVLGGKRGRIPQPRGARNIRQVLHRLQDAGPLAASELLGTERQYLEETRGDHSAKPVEVRRRIEVMHPAQRKIELFARQPAEGWDSWGNEL